MRAPFVSSAGSVSVRELLLVRLEADDGVVGRGEAAPLGTSITAVQAALEDCRDVLAHDLGHEQLLAACHQHGAPLEAIAAIDLALWDLAGRRSRQPLWRMLGAAEPAAVEVNHTIATSDRAAAADEAAAARGAGFRCAKVKVGLGDDAERLAAVRAAAGPDLVIRIDANGAWSEDQAPRALRELEPVGIELCEEPASGIAAVARVSAATNVPIAIDETAEAPGALERRVCAAACLKIVRCGGVSGLLEAARRARTAGYQIYLASMLDGPLGIAAALHAAAAVGPERPSGLATLGRFEDQPDVLRAREGRIAVPSGPGLGEGLEWWYGGD